MCMFDLVNLPSPLWKSFSLPSQTTAIWGRDPTSIHLKAFTHTQPLPKWSKILDLQQELKQLFYQSNYFAPLAGINTCHLTFAGISIRRIDPCRESQNISKHAASHFTFAGISIVRIDPCRGSENISKHADPR